MEIEPFGVEQWMNAWETTCRFNLAETCVESLTVAELLHLAGRNAGDLGDLLPLQMTYGEIEGSAALRQAIADGYDRLGPESVLVTHGTIGANMLVHRALVGPGDVVVALTPTYQQHTAIPASLGAEVRELRLRPENGWLPDFDELEGLARGARLIALTNPNNPTGALIDRSGLERIAQIARAEDAYVLVDEVYRGTEQPGVPPAPSIADVYERGIATAGMSKAFSLAGLRLGWIAGPQEVLEAAMIHRDYDTISVGRIDDALATIALGARERILARSRRITSENLALLANWIEHEPRLTWVRPAAGTTAFPRVEGIHDSRAFCEALLAETGVLFTPGAALGVEGHVRIGFGNPAAALEAGLPLVSAFLARDGANAT